MKLEDFKCITEDNDLDKYLEFYNYVRDNMEHPEWLGTFTKDELVMFLGIGAKLFNYYDNDTIVCSFLYMPITNKSLLKHNIEHDESVVGTCGPIMVNPEYVGHGLQKQMIDVLDDYCRSINKKYCYTKIHPDNIYCINNFVNKNYKFLQTYTSPKDGEVRNDYIKEL